MRHKFPHLLPQEVKIWERFLKDHGNEYQKFDYDVHVGKVSEILSRLPEAWRKGAEAVFRKRIDVVGWQPGKITIFEVKPHAELGALGQLLGYLALYDQEFNPVQELGAALVVDFVDPITERLVKDRNIDVYIYSGSANAK